MAHFAGYRYPEPEGGLEVRLMQDSQPGLELHQHPGQVPKQDQHDDDAATPKARSKTTRNPFGLSPLLFGVLVALVTAIVLGGALGGGLGSAIHSASNDGICSASATTTLTQTVTSSSATTTLTQTITPSSATPSATPTGLLTNYTVPPSASIGSLNLGSYDCPTLNSRPHTTQNGSVFNFNCGIDYVGNDLFAILAYSLYDCCEACANMNRHFMGVDACKALTFWANMSMAYATNSRPKGANCWLKNMSNNGVAGWPGGGVVGAILQS